MHKLRPVSRLATLFTSLTLGLSLFSPPAVANDNLPLRLMRTPDYHGGNLVFSYQGDLWTVGEAGGYARRLTVHEGRESYPHYSPDGRWIAFLGEYEGGRNVFIVPAEGGTPKQLTFGSDVNRITGWGADGAYVTFSASRETDHWFYEKLFKVSTDATYPEALPMDQGSAVDISPDGQKMVFNRHPMYYWWWKRYKGSLNHDLWHFDGRAYQKLTRYEGNDSWPMYGKDKIYFVSDRAGIANIFAYDLKTRVVEQITKHTKDGVQWPGMDSAGQHIVYENEGKLFKLNLATRQTQEVVVYARADHHRDMKKFINPAYLMGDYHISPSGKRVVVEARGEIFTLPAEHGDTRNLSQSSGSRERHPAWSPDGKWIAFVSDISGEEEIYIRDQMGKEGARRVTNTGHFKSGLIWSPDARKILYRTSDYSLHYVDLSNGRSVKIGTNPNWGFGRASWAPDSKWIALNKAEDNGYSHIYLYELGSGKQHKVTQDPSNYADPVFSLDGSMLFFTASLYPGREDESFVYDTVRLLGVSLKSEKADPFAKPEDEAIEASSQKRQPRKKRSPVKVQVDFNGLADRIRPLPLDPGPYGNLEMGPGYLYFLKFPPKVDTSSHAWWMNLGQGTLFAYDFNARKARPMAADIKGYHVAARMKQILVQQHGQLRIIPSRGQAPPGKGYVSMGDMSMALDYRKEWAQIFDESWRMVREHFYDPNYHGVDWPAVKRFYAQFLPHLQSREDLNHILQEMVGELNASHQGARGGDIFYTRRYPVAHLGADFSADSSGYYRFKKIYKGEKDKGLKAPLDADYIEIKEGDYLLAINGQEIKTNESLDKYLVNQHRNKLELTTNGLPTFIGAKKTEVQPLTHDIVLRYKNWRDTNMAKVDTASNGKIGYLHLPDMSMGSLDIFNKFFRDNINKEGLIIDVRYNGGGGIDPQLIDKLERVRYMTAKTRYSNPESWPGNVFEGKIAVLINEYSFSDGEIFPRAMQIRKLGKIIGVPTLGYVIAVSPHQMVDGGSVRKTFVGIWDLQGQMLESVGAQPDIKVENSPADALAGTDRQLDTAIEYLMEAINKGPKKTYPHPYSPR